MQFYLYIQLRMAFALSKAKTKKKKTERDTTLVYFLDSVTLNLKLSFTDEYIKVLPAHINKYITRCPSPYSKVSKKVK